MGGSGGIIIVTGKARTALSDPTVHGQLPDWIAEKVDAILAKDDADWTPADRAMIGHAFTWALCNLT